MGRYRCMLYLLSTVLKDCKVCHIVISIFVMKLSVAGFIWIVFLLKNFYLAFYKSELVFREVGYREKILHWVYKTQSK